MAPRGIRNNNPGNIERGQKWQGLRQVQGDKRFCQFTTPELGVRALMKILLTYQRRYKLARVSDIIRRWAPPIENDTAAYAENVARKLGVKPADKIDLESRDTLIKIAQAITVHENGRPPQGVPANWYESSVYQAAADLALS